MICAPPVLCILAKSFPSSQSCWVASCVYSGFRMDYSKLMKPTQEAGRYVDYGFWPWGSLSCSGSGFWQSVSWSFHSHFTMVFRNLQRTSSWGDGIWKSDQHSLFLFSDPPYLPDNPFFWRCFFWRLYRNIILNITRTYNSQFLPALIFTSFVESLPWFLCKFYSTSLRDNEGAEFKKFSPVLPQPKWLTTTTKIHLEL